MLYPCLITNSGLPKDASYHPYSLRKSSSVSSFDLANFGCKVLQSAYMFVRARKKDTTAEDSKAAAKVPSTPVVTPATPVPEEPALPPPIAVPVKVREPIPEDQQLELFKWILEEKRKVKPKGREEKKRIDEEKALLKQFIRAKSIPNI
ncbi:hypothetical protein TEA_002306 [Camellia sinensis var. sinensis]|uniref:Uncharacterized protein n=1 Tax=Camellia sinensis var. sinensis TaxID=542762 RepID=A0A4V3WLL9_CAMSN|nr:hypothetical protein TEA_002306 [Camellia sinensis var. sinensis]